MTNDGYEESKATHYTLEEGGNWLSVMPRNGFPYIDKNPFAVRFESGWIFDRIAGWRRERFCPTCGKAE